MKKDDKASISLKKVISISIILLFVMGIGVMAASSKLNNVKIILSDGYEMDVLTSKTKISEILDENHIIMLPNEKVIPGLDEEIPDNKTIKIAKNSLATSENNKTESEELTMDMVLNNYNSVTENKTNPTYNHTNNYQPNDNSVNNVVNNNRDNSSNSGVSNDNEETLAETTSNTESTTVSNTATSTTESTTVTNNSTKENKESNVITKSKDYKDVFINLIMIFVIGILAVVLGTLIMMIKKKSDK